MKRNGTNLPKSCIVKIDGRMPCRLANEDMAYRKYRFGRYGTTTFVSPEFREFLKHNKGVLNAAINVASKNLNRLVEGKCYVDKKIGVSIQKICAELNEGGRNEAVLCVKTRGHSFFVKINAGKVYPQGAIEETHALDNFLKKHGNKWQGYTVKLIKPHLISEKVLISDFYYVG